MQHKNIYIFVGGAYEQFSIYRDYSDNVHCMDRQQKERLRSKRRAEHRSSLFVFHTHHSIYTNKIVPVEGGENMAKRDNDEAKKAIGLIAELYLETYMKYTAQLGDPALALTLTNAFIEKLLSSVMPNGKTTTIFWDNSEE